MMVTTTCTQNYTRNQNNAGWQLNAVPVRIVDGDYYIYFPRPWLIVGLCNTLSAASTIPQYQWSYMNPLAPTDQDAYKEMFQAIFLDLAFATCYPKDSGYSVEYVDKGIQATDYRGKFVKYLNEPTVNTPQQIYNSIIAPESVVQKFMSDAAALTPIEWSDKHRAMVEFLKGTIDQELMGAPGLHRINDSGTAVPVWNLVTEYELFIPS